jgi:hypothetical protein
MYNLNRTNRNALISIFSMIAVIFVLGIFKTTSKYQPRPLTIKVVNEKSLFDLEHRIECAPGHTKEGSPYTKSLTPGGLCGAQELVSEHAGYEIEDGIGGSLI